jgi:hypothetical protein
MIGSDRPVMVKVCTSFQARDLIMNNYENSKKARRIASVIYLLIMAVILGGTYLSNQQKEMAKSASKDSSQLMEVPGGFSEVQAGIK